MGSVIGVSWRGGEFGGVGACLWGILECVMEGRLGKRNVKCGIYDKESTSRYLRLCSSIIET